MVRASIVAAVISLGLCACVTPYPQTEIASVSTSLASVETVFDDYYEDMNQYAQDSYVYMQVYRGQPISLKTVDGKGSIYAQADVAARLKAIKLIGNYASLLSKYAGGASSQDLAASAASLSKSAFSLKDAISKTGAGADAYAGPVSSILQTIVGWGTDLALRDKFKTYADQATPQVLAILDLLQQDAGTVLEPQKVIGESGKTAAVVGAYNDQAARLSFDQRASAAATVISAVHAQSSANQLNLGDTLASAKKAVLALQKRVDGAATEADTVAAISDFASRVDTLNTLVDKIKSGK